MIKMPATQMAYFPLKGGLNLVTPPISMPDGMCRDALNFECDVDGGYSRVAGYERYDGSQAPSSVAYIALPHSGFVGAPPALNSVVVGASSAASGVLIGSDSQTLYLTAFTGSFAVGGENLTVGGNVIAQSTDIAVPSGAVSPALNATYRSLAANYRRQAIDPVPGSGPVRGVFYHKDKLYAFRDTEDGLAAKMYVSSPSGWQEIPLYNELAFTNATGSLPSGVVQQGAVSATIRKVVIESGSLQSGVNTGRLIVENPTGGSFAAGAATTTLGGTLTLQGASSPITLAPGGRYEFDAFNFAGTFNSFNFYGVSGVDRAFEYDGAVYTPINTGLPDDAPTHIAAHLNYLWVSYDSSVIRSSIADPFRFEAITGAVEFAVGEPVTNVTTITGGSNGSALAVFTRNKTMVVYGSTEADFQLAVFSTEAGAVPYTAQIVGDAYVLDQIGVRQLSASQNFGNFDDSQLSRIVRPWIVARTGKAVGACISRQRNQYRLFFNDRSALYVTFDNGRVIGMMPIQTNHTFNCFVSEEASDGTEMVFAGGVDGYVYHLDRGTSFDGTPIEGLLSLSFSHMRGPRVRKHWRRAVLEVTGLSYGELEASYEIGYGDTNINQGQSEVVSAAFTPVAWDAFTWDAFYWDGRSLVPLDYKLFGTAENISLNLRSRSADFEPFTLNSVVLHYTPRRQMR